MCVYRMQMSLMFLLVMLVEWRRRYFVLKGSKLFFGKVSIIMLPYLSVLQTVHLVIISCRFATSCYAVEPIRCSAWNDRPR